MNYTVLSHPFELNYSFVVDYYVSELNHLQSLLREYEENPGEIKRQIRRDLKRRRRGNYVSFGMVLTVLVNKKQEVQNEIKRIRQFLFDRQW